MVGFRPTLNIYTGCYFFICRVSLVLLTIRFTAVLKSVIANHFNSEVFVLIVLQDYSIDRDIALSTQTREMIVFQIIVTVKFLFSLCN